MSEFDYLDLADPPEFAPSDKETLMFNWRVARARNTMLAWNMTRPDDEQADEQIIDLVSNGVAFDEVSPTEFDTLVLEKGCNPALALQILG